MHINNGFGWTFDTVAEQYEKFRPGYVSELYDAIFEYMPIDESSNVVEVGMGAGQATLPILKKGCMVTAVEPGEKFCALCREKFSDFSGFSATMGKFEDVELQDNTVDMVYSATAFHWVPEEIGYKKVYEILKSGGAFARFANHPNRDKGNPALSDAIDDLYDRYYNAYYNKPRRPHVEFTESDAEECAKIALKYGFEDIRWAVFHRRRDFTAQEYVMLLGTYSDHIAIEETIKNKFFSGIEQAINDHGGTISIYDTIDLQLARKP